MYVNHEIGRERRRLGRQVDGLFIGWWQGHASPRVLSKVKLQVIGGIADNEKNRGEAYYICPNYNGVWNCCCLLCSLYAMHVPCKMINKLLCLDAEAWYMQVVHVGGTIQDLSQ